MRRGSWILAVSGALALQASGVFAADPYPSRSTGAIPTRYNRPTTSAPATAPTAPAAAAAAEAPSVPDSEAAGGSRNYYEELFGDAPSLTPATKPSAGRVTLTGPAGRPHAPAVTRTESLRPRSAPATRQIPLDDVSKSFPADPEAKGVVQASFDKQPADRSFIQPVHATADRSKHTSAPATSASIAASAVPQVTIEWVKKSDINVGQECQLELVVKNTGSAPATQVTVDAGFPSTVRLTSAEPKPAQAAEKLTWNFESIAPQAEKRLAIKLIPSRRGDLGTSADVRFSSQVGSTFKVEEPLLKMAVKGPSEVLLGDPASQLITISNPGTGIAHDVKLEALLSDGLEHPKGEKLEIEVGSINPGDSQHVRLGLSAIKGGPQTLQLVATSSTEASTTTVWKVNVIAPTLKLAVDGPGLRYKGRNAKYAINIANDGSVPNNNVRVTQIVPEGFQFVSADKGGKYDSSQRAIHWFLGRLDAGQTAQLSCELTANAIGEFKQQVFVGSDAGVRVEAISSTTVEGTAALATEIVDLDDPVEVGTEAAWEIRVRNDGSIAASNINVACELPAGVELLSAKGATEGLADAKNVTFRSLKQLAPGQQAVYRVHVRGTVEGSHRLRARVTSDSLDQPLMMEEATKFYSDSRK